MAPGEFRLRVCFCKLGRLRYLSHLEVMRATERAVRRAALPYALTRGFNPHMKLAFGPALPVGTLGEREYFDLGLREYVPAKETQARLLVSTPSDLAPVEMCYVADTLPSLSAACNVAVYELSVDLEGADRESLQAAMDDVVAGGTLEVEHKGKTKVFDLAFSLPKEPTVRSQGEGTVIDVMTRMGQEGNLRPDALVREALTRISIPEAAVQVARTDILIEEEGRLSRPI
ncbi:MAG: TIGR03936 family radical SAM-associated protein [Coriobacteriia bacterium]|nr:TIGR03936 family radical SAM-associated protein [Coriobacteriia bacterium]